MKVPSTAVLLLLGVVHSVKLTGKENEQSAISQQESETHSQVADMWNAAYEVQKEPEEPEKSPFHFDLVGLAQGLTKSATMAAKMHELEKHVNEAKKTLESHRQHLH